MRHRKTGRKFGRTTGHRTAMSRNLVTKGKELRRWVERVITTAKTDDVAARRAVSVVVQKADVAEKLFSNLMPRLRDRSGGYTRVLKTAPRLGDGAPMVLIELVD
jgi:large subunit ribosomal protein L17